MVAYLFFLIPGAWLGYLAGEVLRHGIAALLYYRMEDLVPWVAENVQLLLGLSVLLAVLGNGQMLVRFYYLKLTRLFVALPVTFVAGSLWLAVALVRPDLWLMPLGGLGVFTCMTMSVFAVAIAHVAMRSDELVEVLGWLLVFVGMAALIHWGLSFWLPIL